jgi:hypothetical protein
MLFLNKKDNDININAEIENILQYTKLVLLYIYKMIDKYTGQLLFIMKLYN